MSTFDVRRASDIEGQPPEEQWLIEGLWAAEAVGIVGGEPKCCKSFLALDVAVSVASGTPCLRRFPVQKSGRVLLFAAEDALHVVRERLIGICHAAGIPFHDLDVHIITNPIVRLDVPEDRKKLLETVQMVRPILLILDPFVRLHRIDENQAAEVAPLLASLREIQRLFHTAVLLVHHARKGAAHARGGQALRGSSELHAWGDSNLYLRRRADRLSLSVEQRAAPATPDIMIELRQDDDALALAVVEHDVSPEPEDPSVIDRIMEALAASPDPLSTRMLRERCRIRTATLSAALQDLVAQRRVVRTDHGYRLAAA